MLDGATRGSMRQGRRVRRDGRGLAEIVGTLLLVVIVVAAAVAFSIFVASYQAQVQAEQAAAHNRALEDIRILGISTTLNTSTTPANSSYSRLTFVAGSLDVNTMTVNELLVNGQFINYYTVTPLASALTTQICELCAAGQIPGSVLEFNLTSLEQVTIAVNLTVWSLATQPHGGFIQPYTVDTSGATNYISLSLFTTLGNDFKSVYAAPTALALTEQSETYSGGSYVPVVVFDGSSSIVPANDTIVSWSWSLENLTSDTLFLDLSGEKALVPQSAFETGDNYDATLTIIDSSGLASTATILYRAS